MIELLWPWAFALAPLPLVLRAALPPRAHRDAALRVPFSLPWRSIEDTAARGTGPRGALLLMALAWLGLVGALARPTWVGEPVALPNEGRDLMLAVDISGSMRVEDMRVGNELARRIDAVKVVGGQFIERRRGDRVGLILFGSRAYVQSPLSYDTRTVDRFLQEAQIGFAGQETAIGDALGLAVKRLRGRPAQSRVLVLLTDGQDTASSVDPLEAAALAASLDIRVHTIGIGADSLTVPGILGSRFGSRRVNPSADLDEATLEAIATRTGGRYFRARDPRELEAIYREIDRLEPVETDTATFRPRRSLLHWPLALAVLASFLLALREARGGTLWPREARA
ncbi:MAG: VWA domain-containing protein [Pseudohaliea sp.]